ncbi:MAG TPA: response regulator, partial [Candidatus Cloacimonas sp.]|nr:response regulator [Candidatus Cloacimonas sp.]
MRHRILVVDDSSSLVLSLAELLKYNGFEVETALSGTEALHKIETEDYDLVICDIEMPGMSGLEFLSHVRKDYEKEIDVILMTGYEDNEYFIEAIRNGASDFIRKPIDSKQMMRSIQTILNRKKRRNDFSEFYNNLEKAEFHFELDPHNFSKFAVSEVFHKFLRQNFDLTHNALNEILICVDEMV